jgi:myosin-5
MMHDKVWVLNPDSSDDQLVWLAGEIETKETLGGDSFRLTIKAVKGRRVETIAVASDAHGEVGSVQRRNEEGQVVEDLIRLTHLHEPAILHALVERFHGELIYTYTGPVLIAVNPFQPLDLYTDAILESYYEGGIVRSQGFEMAPMPPHVYAVAADAYQDMSLRLARSRSARPRGVIRGEDAVSQSILISGESGSGKTVSTKHCLEYLTTVGQAAGDRSKGLKLAAMQRDIDSNKIVQSNPILEAFGNARTLRNDNSSRFGKLVQIHFDGVGEILGGGISSYLLEKVRQR